MAIKAWKNKKLLKAPWNGRAYNPLPILFPFQTTQMDDPPNGSRWQAKKIMDNDKNLPPLPPGPAAHPKVGIAVLCFIIDVTLENQFERKA